MGATISRLESVDAFQGVNEVMMLQHTMAFQRAVRRAVRDH
jgi:hypothetical protein